MKAPSDREESIHVPVGKSVAAIHYQTGELRQSRHASDPGQAPKVEQKGPEGDQYRMVKIIVFCIVSLFLIYNAMTPAKKYHSKKRSRRWANDRWTPSIYQLIIKVKI